MGPEDDDRGMRVIRSGCNSKAPHCRPKQVPVPSPFLFCETEETEEYDGEEGVSPLVDSDRVDDPESC